MNNEKLPTKRGRGIIKCFFLDYEDEDEAVIYSSRSNNEEEKSAREKRSERRRNRNNGNMRVVGGNDATPFQWPFLVAILKNGIFSCGGSIVTASVILTAGHCIGR